MANFTPLTPQQYQKALDAGFSSQQIIQNEKQRKASMTQTATPPSTGIPTSGGFGFDASQGLIADVAHGAAGLANAGGWIQNQVARLPGMGWLKTNIAQNPIQQGLLSTKAPNTIGGIVGQGVGEAAQLMAPTGVISDVQEGLKGVTEGSKLVGALPKIGQYAAKTAAHIIPEAGFGAGYGATRDNADTKSILENALTFGGLSTVFKGAGDLYQALKGGLGENVMRAMGTAGVRTTTEGINKVAQSTAGLKVLADNAKGTMVEDVNGVQKVFDPATAKYGETLQAWKTAATNVFKKYSDIAKKSGDARVNFTNSDFVDVINGLRNEVKNSTSAFKNKAASLIQDLFDNFGSGAQPGKFADVTGDVSPKVYPNKITDLTPQDPNTVNLKTANVPTQFGQVNVQPATDNWAVDLFKKPGGAIDLRDLPTQVVNGFKNVDLMAIQDFIQKVNIDVDPVGKKAATAISGRLSDLMRGIMDSKIEGATGAQYQQARNEYAALKSIEKNILNQWKKQVGKSRVGIPGYVEGFGTINTVLGLATGNFKEALYGLGEAGLGKIARGLTDSELSLQRAFQMITGADKSSSAAGRVFGLPTK